MWPFSGTQAIESEPASSHESALSHGSVLALGEEPVEPTNVRGYPPAAKLFATARPVLNSTSSMTGATLEMPRTSTHTAKPGEIWYVAPTPRPNAPGPPLIVLL